MMERENLRMTTSLQGSDQKLDHQHRTDMQSILARMMLLRAHIDSLEHVQKQAENLPTDQPEKEELASAVYYKWLYQAFREIQQIQRELEQLEKNLNCAPVILPLHIELTYLKNKLCLNEQQSLELESDLSLLGEMAEEASKSLNMTENDFITVTNELKQLYHQVCHANGVTPSSVEHDNETDFNPSSEDSKDTEQLITVKSDIASKELESSYDTAGTTKLIKPILEQIRLLQDAVNHTIEHGNEHGVSSKVSQKVGNEEEEELQNQVIKMKSLLSAKNEQISSLQKLLKSHRNIAIMAFKKLKAKYDSERVGDYQTMMRLRNEYRKLKNECAAFAGMKARYEVRCGEYKTQIENLKKKLGAKEKTKDHLNYRLQLAIQQVCMNEILDDLE